MLLFLFLASLCQDLPEGPGKETVLKLCQDCHDIGVVTMDNRTKDGWKKTVTKMTERGAEGTDEQFEAVVTYLARHYGRINVNKATPEEIAAGAGFTKEEASAIVAYREKNGEFKEWQDLKKVTGLEATKVDARKDHVAVK